MRVAIIGYRGIVGSAQVRLFGPGNTLVCYDAADGVPYPDQDIWTCEFAVIAVGTPPLADGSADLSGLYQVMADLPPGLPALIRSTVPPGTIGGLSDDADQMTAHYGWPPRLIAHAPEFLHERQGGRWPDSGDVPWMVLGGSPDATAWFKPRLRLVYYGTIHCTSALTSELAKYAANLYWANRVTFVNELARITAALGGEWEHVRQAWLSDTRLCRDYTAYEGFPPGFGGRCWPKDLDALIHAASAAGYEPEFLRAIQVSNARFTAGE